MLVHMGVDMYVHVLVCVFVCLYKNMPYNGVLVTMQVCWGLDKSNTRPADILVSNWDGSASAAFDISVTSPLNSSLVVEAGMSSGVVARAAEKRKHLQNDAKCKQ